MNTDGSDHARARRDLAELRQRIVALCEKWADDVEGYPATEQGAWAGTAVALCTRELSDTLAPAVINVALPGTDIPHGSPSSYTNHSCRCVHCRIAWSDYARIRRAAAKQVQR